VALTITVVLVQLLSGLAAVGFLLGGASAEAVARDWMLTSSGADGTLAEIAYVNNLIAHMSLDEEIGRMLVIDFTGTAMTSDLISKIQRYHVGGAILYDRNITSAEPLRALTSAMQGASTIPLLLAIDQEGGTVNRFGRLVGPTPSAESMAARKNPAH